MGYVTVAAPGTITASYGNTNIRDQVVTPFATTGARDSAITSPVDGMLCTITGTDTLMEYNGSAWVIVSEPLQTWTPSLTQGVGVSVTTVVGWYRRENGEWTGKVTLAITSAGTLGSGLIISLPFTLPSAEHVGGSFIYFDSGVGYYVGTVFPLSTTTFSLVVDGAAAVVGGTPNFACANLDFLRINVHGAY